LDQDKQLLTAALRQCGFQFGLGPRYQANGLDIQAAKVLSAPTQIDDYYPLKERVVGRQAVLRVAFLLDPLGNLRFPHLAFALPFHPDQDFVDEAIRLVRRYVFSPYKLNGRAVGTFTAMPVKFVLDVGSGPLGKMLNQNEWAKLLKKAKAGDFESLRAAAYVGELIRSDASLDESAVQDLLVASALRGDDFARLALVWRLSACSKGSLVDRWIFADANAGSLKAKLRWADLLMGGADPQYFGKAKELLESLASSSGSFMRLWAAGLLATAPMEGVRDPEVALQVATTLNREPGVAYAQDPDYAELLAAAQAANGHYSDAVESEKTAIARATVLKWNVSNMQARLSTYVAGTPWRGYLCDCGEGFPSDE
jgi:hypothetical protein